MIDLSKGQKLRDDYIVRSIVAGNSQTYKASDNLIDLTSNPRYVITGNNQNNERDYSHPKDYLSYNN